jgi:glycosyltransferase involved in cell wall biosynthesis
MKLSIITITYNSALTLENTIQSVIQQSYENSEYIIVDGQSTDGTLNIIEKYKNHIHQFVSEKDKGLYDALNKGIKMATGDVIGILHSDDFYAYDKVLENVMHLIQTENSDAVYADLDYVDKNDTSKIVRKWKSGNYKPGAFLNGWMPPHPTFFVRKDCYQKFGMFNLLLKSAADYELMLRFIHKHQIRLSYLPECIVKMRTGGTSNITFKNRWRANREDKTAWEMNELRPRFYTFILKPLRKLVQFF